jgi:hypothetical protein
MSRHRCRFLLGALLALLLSGPARAAVDPRDAATQLLDFAERSYPAYFPGHRFDLSSPPFVYRHYPQTGAYVGVVVSGGTPYPEGTVWVLGGPFGAAPVQAGALTDFITPQPGPTTAQRSAAAAATASSASNACGAFDAFYWEIGDASARLASGSVRRRALSPHIDGDTAMPIASATKWLYGAYVAERRGGQLSAEDVKFLHFRSGYVGFDRLLACGRDDTVAGCLERGDNGAYDPASDGRFHYDGGHMQQHAVRPDIGLGPLREAGLAGEMSGHLGGGMNLAYSSVQIGGGANTSAAGYATFLRRILSRQLQIASLLGAHAVCASPSLCPAEAVYSPAPANELYHYAIGHWVEDDPVVGDGAFSSAGALGFYPWIDSSQRFYGVIARQGTPGSGFESLACGRLVRRAWMTGIAQ